MEHRLVNTTQGGIASQYAYDGNGRRLQAIRNGQVTRYLYDAAGNLLAEADATNTITRSYVYGQGLLAMSTPDGQVSTYHFDGTGHTIALTDAFQNLLNAYAYSPYGLLVNQSETLPQPFRYAGRYGVFTEPHGLLYMRARYYDPAIGRFILEDPSGFAGGDVNLYRYASNNPINFVDPTGEAGFGITGGASAEGGILYGVGVKEDIGWGAFWGGGKELNVGGYTSGGAFAGGPGFYSGAVPCEQIPFVIGGYGGVGGGAFFTNATSAKELGGPFSTWNLNTPIGSLSFGKSGSTWIFSITAGPGLVGSISGYPTTTAATKSL